MARQKIIRLVTTNDRWVGVSERGKRCGEWHGRAKLTQEQVDQMRELREEHHVSLDKLAMHFGISIRTVRDIVSYRIWATCPARFKRE